MKVKKTLAALMVLLMVFCSVPTGASRDPWSSMIVGESFRYVLWKGYDENDEVKLISGTLPDGVELIREYNDTEDVYDFIISGTPMKAGEYPVEFEICPYEAMHSYASLTLKVWNKLKITVTRLPDAVVGEYYSQKIPVTYPEAEFTEWWNPGEGVILEGLGLELKSDGTVCGTPTKAGDFHFYVTVDSLLNLDSDEARIELKIAPPAVPTDTPTPPPTLPPSPTQAGIDARFTADSFIWYVPDEEFELQLIGSIGDSVEIGNVIGDIPEGVKVNSYSFDGEVTVKGSLSAAFAESGGAFTVIIPLKTENATYFVHYLFRPAPNGEMEAYPSGTPLKVPFGA